MSGMSMRDGEGRDGGVEWGKNACGMICRKKILQAITVDCNQ